MNLDLEKTYMKYGRKSKGLNSVFMQYLGYSIGGQKCFLIWNRKDKNKTLCCFSDGWINRNII